MQWIKITLEILFIRGAGSPAAITNGICKSGWQHQSSLQMVFVRAAGAPALTNALFVSICKYEAGGVAGPAVLIEGSRHS